MGVIPNKPPRAYWFVPPFLLIGAVAAALSAAAPACAPSHSLGVYALLQGLSCDEISGYVLTIGDDDDAAESSYERGPFFARGTCSGTFPADTYDPSYASISTINIPRAAHAKSLLLVVALKDATGAAIDPRTCEQRGFRDCLILRASFADFDEDIGLALISDPRCIGLSCGTGMMCERGACVSDAFFCGNGSSGAEDDGTCRAIAPEPPFPRLPDPCANAGADATADAACGVGFCTAAQDPRFGQPDCTCSGGALGVGIRCPFANAELGAPAANIGGVTGYRCLCDLDANANP